jgi:urease accessory protein
LGGVDLPILKRLHQAWAENDEQALQHWNAMLLAFRETKELYLEDIQVGDAFKQWHKTQSLEHLEKLEILEQPTVASMYALNGVIRGLTEKECMIGFIWAWLENQITAASKAMPMGQTDGQNIIRHLIPGIEAVIESAISVEDDDIGSGLVGLSMSSALHEHQYSRLFRS